ncbi:hypothetical protein F5H01DRAFT_323799 [Linnemannia elongata]|nr:hypothetical protein F5H01DRAFT_323799 [Linnemannia elongata]
METLPFSVDIDASKIVDHLTDSIKSKIPDTYKGVDAKDLMLWRVSIPLVPKKDRKDISLGDVPSKEELDETDDLFGCFWERTVLDTGLCARGTAQRRNHLCGGFWNTACDGSCGGLCNCIVSLEVG